MKNVRLLPVVVMAIAALLVFKTIGLVTHGGYVLAGVTLARASGAAAPPADHGASGGGEAAPTGDAVLEDTSPTLTDPAPTLAPEAEAAAGGGHGAPAATAEAAPADAAAPSEDHPAPEPVHAPQPGANCIEVTATLTEDGPIGLETEGEGGGGAHGAPAAEGDAAAPAAEGDAAAAAHGDAAAPADGAAPADDAHAAPPVSNDGDFAASMVIDCLPSGDAVPTQMGENGQAEPLINIEGTSASEQQVLERLAARRTELEQYEQDLLLRGSIVDAAEKRIEERAATLAALEAQISTLVDKRTEMETGQFAGIVAMYENMKPKDAATIFNNLDMAVLLQVAKTMSPRKMAPILAAMDAPRAQELTVQMAAIAEQPTTQMTPDDLAALPQIVGQ